MDFEYIPKTHASGKFGYIRHENRFYSFVEEFNIVGVHWSEPTNISASYFLRFLQEGSSARARGYSKYYRNEDDEPSSELREYYSPLLDHGALWKMRNGGVICTAMPYGDISSVTESFNRMVTQYKYPSSIKMMFLDANYRFRDNGDCMIMIFSDLSEDSFISNCSDDEVYRKAMSNSSSGKRFEHSYITNSFVRDRYVCEYAKRRAKGVCQLCGSPAPFKDKNGRPFLETHHVFWLADGGADSIDNTVALCPNCHRKMHSLNLNEDVEKLKKVLATIN